MRSFDFHTAHARRVRRRRARPARRAGARARLHAHAHRRRSRASWPPVMSTAPAASLAAAGIAVVLVSRLRRQSRHANGRGRPRRSPRRPASTRIVALGGGSSLDCAKGINFVLTNGGTMRDYRGFGKAHEADAAVDRRADDGRHRQRGAVLRDHLGRRDAREDGVRRSEGGVPRRDPRSGAHRVAAARGDRRRRLRRHLARRRVVRDDGAQRRSRICSRARRGGCSTRTTSRCWPSRDDLAARGAMLLGAHAAGIAIEQSMLGATHACANPLTARYGTTHGVAIAVMLPHVVRWNGDEVGDRYAELLRAANLDGGKRPGERLAARLEEQARAGGLPRHAAGPGRVAQDFDALAADAATQWTGTFNPRPFDAAAALRALRTRLLTRTFNAELAEHAEKHALVSRCTQGLYLLRAPARSSALHRCPATSHQPPATSPADSSRVGSGSQKLATTPMTYAEVPTIAAA